MFPPWLNHHVQKAWSLEISLNSVIASTNCGSNMSIQMFEFIDHFNLTVRNSIFEGRIRMGHTQPTIS